jgi:hypothetical protein
MCVTTELWAIVELFIHIYDHAKEIKILKTHLYIQKMLATAPIDKCYVTSGNEYIFNIEKAKEA